MPPPPIEVHDASDPRLGDYANLTDAQLRDADWKGTRGLFIAEGELIVRRLIQSRFPVRSLLVSTQGFERIRDAAAALPVDAPVFVAEPPVLASIVGFPFHRGILACGQRLPPAPLASLLASARTLVVLEDLANSDNVGAVFRNTGSLVGDGAVLLSPGCCDPLYRKALRVSMGQALRVPFARPEGWPDVLDQVAAAGFQLLALTPDPAAMAIHELREPGPRMALLLGAEGPGLTEAAFARAALRVRIPMAAGADSLNVATAGAIALSMLGRAPRTEQAGVSRV